MLREGRHFATLAPNIVVKVPMSEEGLEAIARLRQDGIKTNCTLIFSSNQGLLAARAGASFLSPFVGRLDDINEQGMEVVRELVAMVKTHGLHAQVLAASIRHPRHVTEAALAGAHIATVPLKILRQMIHHPLTETGILQFRKDWEAVEKPSQMKKRRDDAPMVAAGLLGDCHEPRLHPPLIPVAVRSPAFLSGQECSTSLLH